MAGDPRAVETSEGWALDPPHVNLVGGQANGGTDRIVVGELQVRQLHTPIVLAFVDDHSQHIYHYVVVALHTTVAAWMVGVDGDFLKTKKLIYTMWESLDQT